MDAQSYTEPKGDVVGSPSKSKPVPGGWMRAVKIANESNRQCTPSLIRVVSSVAALESSQGSTDSLRAVHASKRGHADTGGHDVARREKHRNGRRSV